MGGTGLRRPCTPTSSDACQPNKPARSIAVTSGCSCEHLLDVLAGQGRHAFKQFRPIDLPVVDQGVRVPIGRDEARALPSSSFERITGRRARRRCARDDRCQRPPVSRQGRSVLFDDRGVLTVRGPAARTHGDGQAHSEEKHEQEHYEEPNWHLVTSRFPSYPSMVQAERRPSAEGSSGTAPPGYQLSQPHSAQRMSQTPDNDLSH
jgi:hypothetical protein